ncbi:MAG: SsrA-binding protein SmpB [Lachnospiraceae bacterium]|nr:SsrA-binding protein SmpB [Lachnospiraceae bacterium]
MHLFSCKREEQTVAKNDNIKLVAQNKKAYHDYFIEDTYEAGISLAGTEVKSLRGGKCSLKESFIEEKHGEMLILGMHISPYEKGNIFNRDPLRTRKLLLHDYEIRKLSAQAQTKGYTIVPLKVYFKGSLVKVEIGLAKGKKLYDKRETIARRDIEREAQREMKESGR